MARYLRQLAGYHPYRSPFPVTGASVPVGADARYMRHFQSYPIPTGYGPGPGLDDFDDLDDFGDDWDDLGAEGSFDLDLFGADEPKKRIRPFEAISRVFSKVQQASAQAQQASAQADAAMQAARQAAVAPPPPQIVTREVQKFTGTEAAITAGVALGAFGLGFLVSNLVQNR